MRRRLMWIFATLATVAAFAPAQPALAATAADAALSPPEPTGTFSCRASGIRGTSPIINSEPIVSNKPGSPCKDDTDEVLSAAVGLLVKTKVITTETDESPGGAEGGNASAEVNNTTINLGGAVIKAQVLASQAAVSCGPNGAVLTGSSKVVGLTINGQQVNVIDQSVTIPAGPLVEVAINEQKVANGKLTQRALRVTSAALMSEIVIAESIADYEGEPCQAPPPKQCSDTIDNDGDGVADTDDPGCHTDGDPTNPDTYDPNDDDETNVVPPKQCSDTVDNDGDGVADTDDPGCHTDGDPTNPDSYDPNDDDETNVVPPKQCSDTVDNDGDGVADTDDPGCHTDGDPTNPDSYDPNDDDETNVPPKQCADNVDNDDDKLTDSEDPECHTDGDPTNPDSYDPNDDDEGK